MALRKYAPSTDTRSVSIKPLSFSNNVHKKAHVEDLAPRGNVDAHVDIDLREVYFLIMHFLSAGPCHRTYGQFWNELLEHQLLPRRYHAWYSRTGARSGDENDNGLSFPLNYNMLVERYPHIEKDHLVKLLKQLILSMAPPSQGMVGGNAPNAADVPTLLGTGSFSLLEYDGNKVNEEVRPPPVHMRWPHMQADQVRGLTLRELGGGFTRHHRAPSIRAACYAIAKPSTMVQKMQNIKKIRGHRNAVYCATFDRSGRYVITGSDDRLVKIWSMETAYCLASCRGHEGDITDLAVSFNNTLVASSSNDCIIRVWRLPDGLPISVLKGHTGAVTAIAFSPRPGAVFQLLSSSDDGTCRIWDARNSHFSPRIYVPRPPDSAAGKNNNGASSSSSLQSHQIFCCAFNASGTVFVTGSSDTLARVWNACKCNMDDSEQPNHEMDILSGHENDVNYVQFSGCSVASRFFIADTSKEENLPKFKNSWFTHDNIVTCSRDGSAIIWIPRSRRSHGRVGRWTRAYHLKVPPPPMPPQPPRGGPRQRILPTPRGVNMIVWSLDNRFVLAAIMDCRICVWNAVDGSLVHSLTGHTESTYVLDVHPFNPRIAMSAGYDGKTIVWDIWEGIPIRIYEIGRFKLVDGKFSPDGTSIILSDDVGQLYILSTGQGESQKEAKYDQFFLGDYRPLVQDTNGNVLDQETQLAPYRRNMQDLLCDSGMIPYPEPYQSMYQQRRLGALGIEWRPSSLRFAVGPDISLDQDYQMMLPLADLDILLDPLPEFNDAMDWEPEHEIISDESDSEYNVMQEDSSGGEQGSLSSNCSGDPECSSDGSDVEDGLRRSKRKKQKAGVEIMTSSGRRVKRRNLDECDGTSLRSNRSRKARNGRKPLKGKKAFKSKSSRPRRAAARNALTLFSRITGNSSDAEEEVDEEEEEEEEEEEDGSEGDLSESDSLLENSNIESSDESAKSMLNEQHKHSKGKEVLADDAFPESYSNGGNRRRLVLKLPIRVPNKLSVLPENTLLKCGNQASIGGSSSKAPEEITDGTQIHVESQGERGYCLDLCEEHRGGKIRWGGVKARSSKRLRMGEVNPKVGHDRTETNVNGHQEPKKEHGIVSPGSETQMHGGKMDEMASTSDQHLRNGKEQSGLYEAHGDKLLKRDHFENDHMPSSSLQYTNGVDHQSHELKENASKISTEPHSTMAEWENGGCNASHQVPLEIQELPEDYDVSERPESSGHRDSNGLHRSDLKIEKISGSVSNNKMYNAVYRRTRSYRARTYSDSHDDVMEESTSNLENHNPGIASNNLELREGHVSEHLSQNLVSSKKGELFTGEWRSNSIGLRSTRNKRGSYHFRDDTSSLDKRKSNHQPNKGTSWLMLSSHEGGSRYIPQQGDEVVYLRQGHQEFINFSHSHDVGPWRLVKERIRDSEFCKVESLEYSTLPGSGESCCKMTLRFVEPSSSVFGKTFKLTLPEVIGFPDFLVERTRYDASMRRNWTHRDKCQVWWKNDGDEDGDWWDGRILAVKAKSCEFPDSPWERYIVQYKSDPQTHLHSPWELFDADTQWEQPHIDDVSRKKLLSVFAKLDQSANRAQDHYGVLKLNQVAQKSKFLNRFPVPLSLDVIRSRLENNYYRSVDAVKHDIMVMLSNAESYFGKNAELSNKMKRLSDMFARTLASL